MAESRGKGQVLWVMLMLLGLLAELASVSLQLAARGWTQAVAEADQQAREARADAIARALEAMPVPSVRSAAMTAPPLWHPASPADRTGAQGCGTVDRASYLAACAWPVPGDLAATAPLAEGWHWQLLRLPDALVDEAGTDEAAFPLLRPQHWRLLVVVSGPGGLRTAWRHDYRQQAAP